MSNLIYTSKIYGRLMKIESEFRLPQIVSIDVYNFKLSHKQRPQKRPR